MTGASDRPRDPRPDGETVAIYHVVYRHERFEDAAGKLFELVQHAEGTRPGQRRALYLDIEGHRNEQDDYARGMLELQREFILGVLMPFLAEAHLPLIGRVTNPRPQRADIPDQLVIQPTRPPHSPDTP